MIVVSLQLIPASNKKSSCKSMIMHALIKIVSGKKYKISTVNANHKAIKL